MTRFSPSAREWQVVDCSPVDLSIGSVLAKATPQLGPKSPPCQSSSVVAGSLRDLLQNEGKQKWYFDSSEAAAQPWKRKKDAAEEDAPRSEADLVEVLAENDWCVTPPGYVASGLCC